MRVIAIVLLMLVFIGGHVEPASYSKHPISIKIDQNSRWLSQDRKRFKGNATLQKLYGIKKNYFFKKYKTCLSLTKQPLNLFKDWIFFYRLKCAVALKNKPTLRSVLKEVSVSELKMKPSSRLILPVYIQASLDVLDLQIAKNRASAWSFSEKLTELEDVMSKEQRIRFYLLLGELSFVDQKGDFSMNYFSKVLALSKTKPILEKIKRFESFLKDYLPKNYSLSYFEEESEFFYSNKEKNLYKEFEKSLNQKNYVDSIKDGLKFLEKFPSHKRASYISSKMLGVYFKAPKPHQSKILSLFSKAHPHWRVQWAYKIYLKGFFEESLKLSESLHDVLKESPQLKTALWISSRAYHNLGKYRKALKRYKELSKGLPEGFVFEGLFKQGILNYRLKKYEEALGNFEKLSQLALDKKDRAYRAKALYWSWKSLMKNKRIDKTSIEKIKSELLESYRLNYYSLLLRAFYSKDKKLSKKEVFSSRKTPKLNLWLLGKKKKNWSKIKKLIQAGWFKEAQVELDSWSQPQSEKELLAYAALRAQAFDYTKASIYFYGVFNKNPAMVLEDFVSLIYPREFEKALQAQAQRYKIPALWLRSLVRQESQFDREAFSPSQAVGLTQMLEGTAVEVAQDLNEKSFQFPDSLQQPQVSLKFGAYYFKKLLNSFQGYLPLALSAYNAGPGRTKNWLKARGGEFFKQVQEKSLSDEDMELLLEEIPWFETNDYVRAILKNIILYQLLQKGFVELERPIWTQVE